MLVQNKQNYNLAKAIKTAFYFVNMRSNYFFLYALLIPGLILLRVVFDLYERQVQDDIVARVLIVKNNETMFNISISEIIIFMITKFVWHSVEFVIKMLFEILVTPLGGVLVQYFLNNVLNSEDSKIFDISPLKCEYDITEGSKMLAKIVRSLFIVGFTVLVDIIKDFYYIVYKKRNSSSSNYFSAIFMLLVLIFSILKFLHLRRSFANAHKATELNAAKEKQYVETLEQLQTVKTSQEENKIINRYSKITKMWEDYSFRFKLDQLTNVFMFIIIYNILISSTIYYYIHSFTGVVKESDAETSGKVLSSILGYCGVITNIPDIFDRGIKFYKELGECVALSKNIADYLVFRAEKKSQKIEVAEFNDCIEVKDLNYVVKDKFVFSGVNMRIGKGEKIALFGKNGTGKSSIFKLILGFDNYSGMICFDGINIKDIFKNSYRSLITYVPQDTKLFDGTIIYNLTFGNNASYKDVIEECKRMGIHDTIMTFPNGYNTSVGDFGKSINGGLRQKIFYTRALLCDTEIYMFDEPTNNLDTTHSNFILDYINDPRFSSKSFFVICHDMEIVRQFPKVLHFIDGKINEVDASFTP